VQSHLKGAALSFMRKSANLGNLFENILINMYLYTVPYLFTSFLSTVVKTGMIS